ncbi:MAG: DUF3015 domain-containing protein [Gammaproteobacteria bacterium]|nr:DUF3015 domain-containing protein [Gammaproteobacteria bacterium]MDH5692337.1 DUF3015 domain-containing protein [Gammaproteobacteria bacterium]
MKRILSIAMVACFAAPFVANAGNNGPGCGLGTNIWKGKTGLLAHTSAATTNGSLSNGWFGITSGSLGCNGDDVVSNEYQKKVFVASNIDSLATDISRGSGDHLESLAALMGVQSQDRDAFYSLAQRNYDEIFKSENTNDYQTVLSALDTAMRSDQQLSKYIQ